MTTISALILACLGLVVLFSCSADATCCYRPCDGLCNSAANRCDDCTTSSTCCATGACNMFCCNCDGECRKGVKCWNCDCPVTLARAFYGIDKKENDDESARESMEHVDGIFDSADDNEDNRLSYEETGKWLRINKPVAYESDEHFESEFKKMDRNGDRFLTKEEVDPHYPEAARKFKPKN